jgi:cell wall-associated NlpC family hydrolase
MKFTRFAKFTIETKKQMIAAILMAVLGAGVCIYSRSFVSAYDKTMVNTEAKLVVMEETIPRETVPVTEAETEAEEETTEAGDAIPVAALDTLNLSLIYPEEVDVSDPQNSYAAEALRELSLKDSAWLSSIYSLAVKSPEKVAGIPLERWTKTTITFYDENGRKIAANSNSRDIMAMANTYFYYSNPWDYDGYMNYAMDLWEKSHTFRYTVSEVYTCDGSLDHMDEDEEDLDGLEDLEDVTAIAEAETNSEEVVEAAAGQSGEGAEVLAEPAAETLPESTSETVGAAVETTAANSEAMTATASSEALPESSPVPAETVLSNEASGETTGDTAAAYQYETKKEIGPGIALMEASIAAESAAELAALEAASETTEEASTCPGHVDIQITAVITGISDSKGSLFAKDKTAKAEEGSWQGWTQENRGFSKALVEKDWKEAYGLLVSSSFIASPLSSGEIIAYMNSLPENITGERRQLIHYALTSVGTVPYYWGGKPSVPDYEGNYFGSLIAPDKKGRMMKGLDCSGWVNWVYWSALGKRLTYEGTSGLKTCGTEVSRTDLQPGDIILKTGSDAHVVMFLGWENDGKMKVIHESSGIVNNVTISVTDAGWKYYRKLLD